MIRAIAFLALLVSLTAGAQAPEQQKCQTACTEPMAECMMPCIGNKDEPSTPEKQSKTMACVKKCSDTQAICLKGCEKKAKTP